MATTDRLLYISSDGLVRQLGFDPTAADLGGAAGVASSTHAATSKTTPVDADEIPLSDSAASWGLVKLTWANIKATLKTYFDTLYLGISATAANASQLLGKTWGAPDPIGSTTPNTGKFTSLTSTGGYTQSVDYSEVRLRATSGANLNGWRLATLLNGANDGDVVLQHSTDNFSTNFSTPIRFSTTGYTGLGIIPLSGSTSGLTTGSDITLSGTARAIFGNLYYLGGWKYAGAGRAGYLKWGTTDTDVFSIAVCPNNAGGAGATATPIPALAFSTTGGCTFIAPVTSGYGTGAGGTVTQATNKGTGVTLHKPCGQITMNAAEMLAGATVAMFVTNSLCDLNSQVILSLQNPSLSSGVYYNYWSTMTSNGFFFFLKNIDASSRSDAVVVNFAVIKGSAS